MEPAEYDRMRAAESSHWWYRGLRALVRQHLPADASRVLDAGCGTGAQLADLGTRKGAGIDAAPAALAHCRARGLTALARASVSALPFPDNCFDAVVSLDVLYHRAVGDPVVALQEYRRVLRPGGVLILNVPAYAWLHSRHDEAIHTGRRFTRGALVRMVEDAGLEIRRATYWNTVLFPAVAMLRLAGKASGDARSDLEATPGRLQQCVGNAALAVERGMMKGVNLPVGLSVFVVARKASP